MPIAGSRERPEGAGAKTRRGGRAAAVAAGAVLVLILVACNLIRVWRTLALQRPAFGEGMGLRVDVNSASDVELALLPGIGPARAAAIIADREANGPFREVQDLERVKGLTSSVIRRLEIFVTCAGGKPRGAD